MGTADGEEGGARAGTDSNPTAPTQGPQDLGPCTRLELPGARTSSFSGSQSIGPQRCSSLAFSGPERPRILSAAHIRLPGGASALVFPLLPSLVLSQPSPDTGLLLVRAIYTLMATASFLKHKQNLSPLSPSLKVPTATPCPSSCWDLALAPSLSASLQSLGRCASAFSARAAPLLLSGCGVRQAVFCGDAPTCTVPL